MLSYALKNLFRLVSPTAKYNRHRQNAHRRRLKLEQLENRQLLATDLATIAGVVFTDANDNEVFDSGTETRLQNVTVNLFLDDGDGVFEPGAGDGAAIDTATTDSQGQYSFDRLAAGSYFVQQVSGSGGSSGLLLRDTAQLVTVTSLQAAGNTTIIDDYNTGLTGGGAAQLVTAAPTSTSADGQDIPGVLGGQRDIFVDNTGATGNVTVEVDGAGVAENRLRFEGSTGATGTASIIYDGSADTSPASKETVEVTGLGSIDLTEAGTRNAFAFSAFSDFDITVTITVHDGTNTSSVNQLITGTGLATTLNDFVVPFSSFTGVNFTTVGAVVFTLNVTSAVDGMIDFTGTVGPEIVDQDLPNLNPMSIGDRVFSDLNNNGLLDSGETGLAGVVLQLFLDEDGDGVLDVGETAVLDGSSNPVTATTDSNGNYVFSNLLPNSPTVGNPAVSESYIVVIANSQTALNSRTTSTGNNVSGAAPNPSNDVDSDDNGTLSGSNTVSAGLVLVAGSEPTSEDSNANTNMTLDFGFTPSIDVEITKSGTATIDAGGNITYTLTVTNNSPIAATNIVVTDDLPSGVTFIPNGTNGSASSASWTQQSNPSAELTATIASLAASGTQTLTVVVSTNPAATPTTLTNTASVTSDGIDTDTSNNTDDAATTVTRNAVLTLTKSDGTRTTVSPGDQFTYTLTVTNTGVSTANNVTLVDLLPLGYSFVSFGSGSQGSPVSTDVSGRDQISAGVTSLAVGATMVVEVVVSVDSTIAGTTIVNSATADSDDSTAVTASDTNSIVRNIDLEIEKTVNATTVGVGGQVTYTLSVTNNGAIDVTGIEVDDDLPTGFTLASTGNPSSIASNVTAQRDFIWTVGTIAAGQTSTVQVIVDVATSVTPGSFTNSATVAVDRLTGFTDTVSNNNSDTVDVTVEPRFDLLITKSDGVTSVTTGDLVTYTITVNNDGPSAATNVQISDTLPAGLEFVSATSNSTSIGSATGQAYSATIASLADNETRTITLVARVRASATGTQISNTATVTATNAATQETGTRANSATDVDTLNRVVNLNITKVDTADPVLAGASFSYTITAFNSGSADAPSVLFSDPLPSGVTFVSGTFTVNETVPRTGTVTFNSSTNQLEANLGTLLAGGSSTVNRALITLNVTAAGTARDLSRIQQD